MLVGGLILFALLLMSWNFQLILKVEREKLRWGREMGKGSLLDWIGLDCLVKDLDSLLSHSDTVENMSHLINSIIKVFLN